MSKRKLIVLVLSLLVIIGLGFASFSAMGTARDKSVNNTYSKTEESSSNVGKNPETSPVKQPEEKVTGKQADRKERPGKKHGNMASAGATASIKRTKANARTEKDKKRGGATCSLTVRGPISQGNKIIFQQTDISVKKGDTVSAVLFRVAKKKKVAVAYQGARGTVYIRGISGLFEFDRGSGSGWLYSVNNKFPGYSAGKKKVKNGDHIQWLYTEDLGKDRHAPLAGQK